MACLLAGGSGTAILSVTIPFSTHFLYQYSGGRSDGTDRRTKSQIGGIMIRRPWRYALFSVATVASVISSAITIAAPASAQGSCSFSPGQVTQLSPTIAYATANGYCSGRNPISGRAQTGCGFVRLTLSGRVIATSPNQCGTSVGMKTPPTSIPFGSARGLSASVKWDPQLG